MIDRATLPLYLPRPPETGRPPDRFHADDGGHVLRNARRRQRLRPRTGHPLALTTADAPSTVPVITSNTSVATTVGTFVSFALTATNVPTRFAAVGLPPGLSLDAAHVRAATCAMI